MNLKLFFRPKHFVLIFIAFSNVFADSLVGTYKKASAAEEFGPCPSEIKISEEKDQKGHPIYRILSNDESLYCMQKMGFTLPGRSGGSIFGTIRENDSYVEECVSGAWDIRLVNQKLESKNEYGGYQFNSYLSVNPTYVENRIFYNDSTPQTGVSLLKLNSTESTTIKIETWGKKSLSFSSPELDRRRICVFEKTNAPRPSRIPWKGILFLDFSEYL